MKYKITHKQILRALSILRENDFVVTKSTNEAGLSRKSLSKIKNDYGDAVYRLIDSSGGWDKVSVHDFNVVTGKSFEEEKEEIPETVNNEVTVIDPDELVLYSDQQYQDLLRTARVEALNKLRQALKSERNTRTIIEGFTAINEASSKKDADEPLSGQDEYLQYFIKGYIKK